MELSEELFLKTSPESKKYAKRLMDYIYILLKKERILEAKFYFESLYKIKPRNHKTIRLGYKLSIASFDIDGVNTFDKLLFDSKPDRAELLWYRLSFYHSRNNVTWAMKTCEDLLSLKLKREYLISIVEFCLNQRSYPVAASLAGYLKENNIMLNERGTSRLKNIAIEKLANTVARLINA